MAPLNDLPHAMNQLFATAMTFLGTVDGLTVIEYAGAGLSIMGAELISRKGPKAPWGWAFWMVANLAFLTVSVTDHRWGWALTQAWFLKTSIAGISNYLLPKLKTR